MQQITTVGRYELLQRIGRGSVTEVYLAFDPTLQQQVAVKVFPKPTKDDDRRAELFQLIDTISVLSHPGIVQVREAGEQGNRPYLVMDYLPGLSLAEQVELGPMSIMETARYISIIAPALNDAHMMGIVHKGIRPSNILFNESGEPVIADFGMLDFEKPYAHISSRALRGDARYASPESGFTSRLTLQADIYQLGVLLFRMLAGHTPYTTEAAAETFRSHVENPIPNIRVPRPDLPNSVHHIVTRAMAKRPADRYVSTLQLMEDLLFVLDEMGVGELISNPDTALYIVPPVMHTSDIEIGEFDTIPEWADTPTGDMLDELATMPAPASSPDIYATSPAGPDPIPVGAEAYAELPEEIRQTVPVLPLIEVPRADDVPLSRREKWRQRLQVRQVAGRWRQAEARRAGANEIMARLAGFTMPPIMSWLFIAMLLSLLIAWIQLIVIPNRVQIAEEFCAMTGDGLCGWIAPAVSSEASPTPTATPASFPIAMPTVSPVTTRRDIHQGMVTALAYNADGSAYASAGEDGRVVVFDSATGEERRVFTTHTQRVAGIVFNPDGTRLVSASHDGKIVVWNLITGAEFATYQHPSQREVSTVDWSSDGRWILSGGFDGVAVIWDTTQSPNQALSGYFDLRSGPVTAGHFIDNTTVVITTDDQAGNVKLFEWDIVSTSSEEPVLPVDNLPARVYAIAEIPNTPEMMISADNGAYIYDLASMEIQQTYDTGTAWGFGLSRDADRVVFADLKSQLLVRDLQSGMILRQLSDISGQQVTAVAWSPDGSHLITGWNNGQVISWDLSRRPYDGVVGPAGTPVPLAADLVISRETVGQIAEWQWLGGHFDVVRALAFSPDGSTLISGGQDAQLVRWNLSDGTQRSPLSTEQNGVVSFLPVFNWWVVAADYHPGGAVFASTGTEQAVIVLWDAVTGVRLTRIETTGELQDLRWSPDGTSLAAAVSNRTEYPDDAFCAENPNCSCAEQDLYCRNQSGVEELVEENSTFCIEYSSCECSNGSRQCDSGLVSSYEINLSTLSVMSTTQYLPGIDAAVRHLAFDPTGTMLAAALAGNPGHVIIWDAASGRQLGNLISVGGTPRRLAWEYSDKLVVTHSRGVEIWDPITRRQTGTFADAADKNGYYGTAWNPSGSIIAVGRTDGSVVLLDETGSPLRSISLDTDIGPARTVAFSEDGRMLASGGSNGMIVIWVVQP